MRAEVVDAGQQGGEEFPGGAPVVLVLGAVAQRLPQRAAAADRQAHQAVVGQAAEWAGQQAGEAEIVLRQQQRVGQRHQVLHRRLSGQQQAIEAGDGHAARLQRAHQGAGEIVAPAHEHHHVAGGKLAVPAGERHGAAGFIGDPVGQPLGQDLRRGALALVALRHRPRFRVRFVRAQREGPQLDASGMSGAIGIVAQLAGVFDAGGGERVGEHRIDQCQHRLGRAERHVQRHLTEFLVRCFHPPAQRCAGAIELVGVGALEGVDRLLAIAHREHRAVRLARAETGKKFLGQRVGDAPLCRRGVLHLVQQQVVDAAVELVQHPGGAGIDQQVRGAADQVVVVQQPGVALARGVGVQHRRGERHQRVRHCGDFQRPPAVLDRFDTRGFLQERLGQRRLRLGQVGVDEGAGGARLAGFGVKFLAPVVPDLDAGFGVEAEPEQDVFRPRGDRGRAVLVDERGGAAQAGFLLPVHRVGQDLRVGGCGDAERAALRGDQVGAERQRVVQAVAVGLEGDDVAAELLGRGEAGQQRQRALHRFGGGGGQHVLARLGHGIGGVGVVHQAEMRRQRRFQREAAQQRLAEGVDGADAHAAGEVQHLGEQRARFLAQRVGGGDGEVGQVGVEGRVGQGDPCAEGVLQADRHFGRGGLGEGEALDALRRDGWVGEHQAQQAVGQQLGLAGAGRGGDERRRRGVCGAALFGIGTGAGGVAHGGILAPTEIHGYIPTLDVHAVFRA